MTMKEARQRLAAIGYSLRKTDGEYRVNVSGAHDDTAYYTDDLTEAVETAEFEHSRHMGNSK